MVIVKFTSGVDWYKANWAFRRFLADFVAMFPDEGKATLVLEQAEALGGLFFDDLDQPTTIKLTRMMHTVAEAVCRRRDRGRELGTPESQDEAMYADAIRELLDGLESEVRREA